jgi:hypothetical protein
LRDYWKTLGAGVPRSRRRLGLADATGDGGWSANFSGARTPPPAEERHHDMLHHRHPSLQIFLPNP